MDGMQIPRKGNGLLFAAAALTLLQAVLMPGTAQTQRSCPLLVAFSKTWSATRFPVWSSIPPVLWLDFPPKVNSFEQVGRRSGSCFQFIAGRS
jgi:hypothetical protein